MSDNMNLLQITTDSTDPYPLMDSHAEDGDLRLYLRKIKSALLGHIGDADAVLGCVAWLTDPDILVALASKRVVSILVQKEDFLRPDSKDQGSFHRDLRHAYGAMPRGDRFDLPSLGSALSTNGDTSFDAIRCVGFSGAERFRPRMHHKFCVFARFKPIEDHPGFYPDWAGRPDWLSPYAAWTGSFNWTKSAANSLENAIFTTDKKIVQSLTKEWGNCFALSEPLDWTSEYVEPEYRIGT